MIETLQQDLNFKCSLEDSVAVDCNVLWLSIEDMCNEKMSKIKVHLCQQKNYSGLMIFKVVLYNLCFMNFSSIKLTVYPLCLDTVHLHVL